jgi:membrane-associated phospholipid phosphatase
VCPAITTDSSTTPHEHAGGGRELRLHLPLRRILWGFDYLSLGILGIYTLLAVVFVDRVPSSTTIIAVNLLSLCAIVAVAVWFQRTGSRIAAVLRSFYVLPLGYMLYVQVHNFVPLVHPAVYDTTLASWDRAIFGGNPTEWFRRISTPALTEYMQISYSLFQLMLVVPAVEFFRRRHDSFLIYVSTITLGFYSSYLLYFVMPAIGPRFEIHEYQTINAELPGLMLTQPLRQVIDAGNNIPRSQGVDPFEHVNRDCMPSGHTMMSLLAILLCWRHRSRWRWLVTVGGTSVVLATVYLRYHYVVDLLAGAALALLLFAAHESIARAWRRIGVAA